MQEETIGEVSEESKRPKKTFMAVLLIVIVGVAAVIGFVWWYAQRTPEEGPAARITEIIDEIANNTQLNPGEQDILREELTAAYMDLKARASELELEDRVNIYNWAWYIDDRLNTLFSEATGCTVVYDTFETSDEVWARLSDPPSNYDVAVPSAPLQEYYDPEFGGPGAPYIEEIDHDLIPNHQYLFNTFKDPPYDPDSVHSVPYMFGTTGIAWNTMRIDEEDRRETMTGHQGVNWAHMFPDNPLGEAFLEKCRKRVTMIPGSETICYAMKYLGYSINDVDDEAKVDEAVELMKLQKPYLLEYADASKYMIKLTVGAYWTSMVWSGDAYVVQQENPDVEYSIPVEGSDLWVDCMVIPKGAPHPNAAHAWIDWMITPVVAAVNSLATEYSNPVEASLQYLPDWFKNDLNRYPPEEWWGMGADAKLEFWRAWTSEERSMMTEKRREVELA